MAKSCTAHGRVEVVGLEQVRTATEAAKAANVAANANTHTPIPTQDYFVENNGVKYAGTHLLVDLWGAANLDNQAVIDEALRECIRVSGATLLHIHLHTFQENGGISGVAVLAESHISIHTWPERAYAAIDIFMCGTAQPHNAIPVLRRYFQPQTVQLGEQKRGVTE